MQIARDRVKLTQSDVATRSGVSQNAISEFENGKTSNMKATNLAAICRQLGVTVEYVLSGSRVARDDEEAEAIALLRAADDAARALALKSLRGMLAQPETASPKPPAGAEPPKPKIAAGRSKIRLPGVKPKADDPVRMPPGVVPRES